MTDKEMVAYLGWGDQSLKDRIRDLKLGAYNDNQIACYSAGYLIAWREAKALLNAHGMLK